MLITSPLTIVYVRPTQPLYELSTHALFLASWRFASQTQLTPAFYSSCLTALLTLLPMQDHIYPATHMLNSLPLLPPPCLCETAALGFFLPYIVADSVPAPLQTVVAFAYAHVLLQPFALNSSSYLWLRARPDLALRLALASALHHFARTNLPWPWLALAAGPLSLAVRLPSGSLSPAVLALALAFRTAPRQVAAKLALWEVLAAYLAVHCAIAVFGRPEVHVSTQRVDETTETAPDEWRHSFDQAGQAIKVEGTVRTLLGGKQPTSRGKVLLAGLAAAGSFVLLTAV